MRIDLGKLEETVEELVESGRFSSPSDVLQEGVRLVAERERLLQSINSGIEEGLADLDAGRIHSAADVRARLMTRFGG